MEQKKLNLDFIGKHLQKRYSSSIVGYQEFSPNGVPYGAKIYRDENVDLCVALRYTRKENPDDMVTLMYYPTLHQTKLVRGQICLSPFNRVKQQSYLGKYIRVKIEEKDDFLIFTQELRSEWNLRTLPESFRDAEERLNVRFLLSSDQELVEQSWVEDKKLEAIVWDKTVGYLYGFTDSKGRVQTWLISTFCDRVAISDDLKILKSPKLVALADGTYMYFNGKRFIPRKTEFLDKDEIRAQYAELSEKYPHIKYYGHLIPLRIGSATKPFWLVGTDGDSYVMISPQTGEVKFEKKCVLLATAEIAEPDDEVFFKS